MFKVLCAMVMRATPQEVIIDREMSLNHLNQNTRHESTLKQHMLQQVPEEVWSKHETDVGLVKSVNPIVIELKPIKVILPK